MPSTAAERTRASMVQGTWTSARPGRPSHAAWGQILRACGRRSADSGSALPPSSEPEAEADAESRTCLWRDLKSSRAWPNGYTTLRAYTASSHSKEDPHNPPDQRATLSTTGITGVAAAPEGEVAQEVSETADERSDPRTQQ